MADSGNPYDDLDPSALNPHVRLSHEESTNPYADLDPSAFDTGDGGSSTLGSFARNALRSVIPSAAGLAAAGEGASAGAKVGGAIGEFFEPVGGGVPGALVGGLVGGFAGMMGGSYVGERAQDYGLSKLPDSWVESLGQDDRQQRLDQEQHPYASLLGGLAPFALTMTPFGEARAGLKTLGNTTALQRIMSNPMTSRVFSGALMGGMELGQEAAQGDVDWNKGAIATVFGLVFTRPNHFGEKIEGAIPRAFGQPTGAEIIRRYTAESGRIADRARSPREPAIYPEQPEYQERGDLVRGQQDSGLGDLYDALTEQRHEDPGILGADAPHYLRSEYEPTLIDAWAFGVGGPGTTEATASGALERAPEVEKAAQAAQREEIATVGAPPTPDIAAAARAAHPEAFAELDALKSQHAALTKAAEESPTPEPLLEQVKAVEAKIAEVAPEVSAAYRRAAEAKGGETVAPAPIAPAVDHGDLQPIVDDVKRQFMAAGRPADEAEALGHVVASRMAARSEAFEGKIGTPQEIYRREGAEIRGADGKMARVGGPRVKPGPPDTNLEKPVPAPTPTAHEEFPAAPETPIDRAAAKEDEREKAPPSDFAPPPEPTENLPPSLTEAGASEPVVETGSENTTTQVAPDPRASFVQSVREKLATGEKPFKTIVEARALAKEHGLEIGENESANKVVDELVERAVVLHARDIVDQAREASEEPKQTFAKMVKLYENQPNLSTRTSTSIAEQAYSTPAPLAYVASRLADITHETYVLEPTAGNGMLLMEADPRRARVNELNKARAESLKSQGFRPSVADGAAESTFADDTGKMDAIIANPPFGSVREGGKSKVFSVGGFNTTNVDHAIVLNSLKAMKAEGKATLIIGGVMGEDPKVRAEGYGQRAKRRFFHELLKNYKVTDIFTVSGDLYAKQGAGFPVDVITIDGKGKSERDYLTKEPPPLLKTWDEVGAKLDGLPRAETSERTTPGSGGETLPVPVEAVGEPGAGNAVGGEPAVPGEHVPDEQPGLLRPGEVDGSRDSSEPGHPGGGDTEHPVAGNEPVNGGNVREPNPEPAPERGRTLGEAAGGQAPYEPASQKGVKLNTLLPENLRDATYGALDRLEREHGNIDDYVANALGRDKDDLGAYFSAEQIDAIGLGISNIQKGEGFIIGDQTGIGKGRVVAAMISYAKRKGLVPVFVTEKPDLFGDMWRDLHDIGWNQQLGRPIDMMMTNANTRIPLDDEAVEWTIERDEALENNLRVPERRGQFSASQSTAKARDGMRAVANGEANPDVVFTTYDQMNAVKGSETDRRAFLRRIAPRSFLIMDEAHNAGGSAGNSEAWRVRDSAPPRSEVFREAVGKAHSVMYSSATYAKSPSVMTLYSKTDMAKAVKNAAELPDIIKQGGVPLQQIVASMLSKAGQYIRRERSFEGVSYDHENIPVSDKSYSEFSSGLRAVFEFDRAFEEERGGLGHALAAEHGGGTARDSGVGEASAQSTSFSAIMHNVISQMIMALKAEKAGERAVAALKAGEKPVIAVSKTNDSFIKDYADEAGLKVGDVANINFSDILKRYLERTRRVTIKTGGGETVRHTIPLKDMSPHAQGMYREAMQKLDAADMGDLPVSPIDAMRNVLAKAGYSVREITGRDQMLDYSGADPVIVKRPASEVGAGGKKSTVKQFNDGKVDAVILNKSGSTGISLHASSKFKDQRRRRMIIAEADPNIDTHMQMLGRVHRTGQVMPPAYTHLSADIPAEVRPTAVLMSKMASLNANTTGAKKSKFTADAVDFLNHYGDEVAAHIMRHDPELSDRLGNPSVADDDGRPKEGAAAKVTGRLTLLDPQGQQELLDRITRDYQSVIAQEDAAGTNDLEAKSLDLRAKTLSTRELKPATGTSPFQSPVNLEKVSMKAQGRSYTPDEVASRIASEVGSENSKDLAQNLRGLAEKGRTKQDGLVSRTQAEAIEYLKNLVATLKDPEAKKNATTKANEVFVEWREKARMMHLGATVDLRMGEETVPAIVTSFDREKEAKNPTALSSWNVTFALPTGERSLNAPLSRIAMDDPKAKLSVSRSRTPPDELARMFEEARKEGREDRYMVTGNILAGFSQVSGQIVNHTMENGEVRPAILMSRSFNEDRFLKGRTVQFDNGDHVLKYLDSPALKEDATVRSKDGIVTISKDWNGVHFAVPAARQTGGRYYADATVRAVYDNWQKKGSTMQAVVNAPKAQEIIDAMMKTNAVFETKTNQDLAQSLADRKLHQATDKPTPRERIEQAYLSITGGRRDEFVRFTELRKKLADLDRPKVDAALRDILKRDATASLAHHDDPRQLARADHDAAFNPYGEPFHGIIISSETRDSGPAVSPAAETAREPAGAKPTLSSVFPAYERAMAAQGGFSSVKISDLLRESGASKEELQKLLLDEAKAGRVTIHPSTSEGAFQDKALQDAAIRLPGKAEPYTNVVFNDETVADLQNDEGRDLLQSAHGKISLRPGERSIITIMRTANASTAIHELGHDWLEMLKRDAAHPEAPQKMRDMWSVAKRELGVGVDGAISTKSHEKFANGYMRWLYEGVAPTRALDRVFKMFREWLLPLYDKMKGLQVEISPGLRSVFEYMHSTRDRDTVVTPHVEPAPELHDLHAAEAEHVPAEHAGGAADRIEAERPHFDDAQPPREIADEIAEAQAETAAGSIADAGGETGGGDGGRGEMVHGGEQAGHEPAGSGVGGTGGPVGKGGNAAAPEGGKSAGGSGPTSGRPESDGALGNVPLAPRPSPLIGAGESPFVDKAGNFKRANINVPDDVWKAIKDRSEAAGDNIDARRAPTTWGQTANLARAMGKAGSEALVDGWVRGRAMNAEQIVGLVDMLQDQATEVGRLTRLADESPEGVLTFATEQARLDMVLKTVQGATAEAGRALNIFRMMQSRFKSIDEMMRAATGRTLFQKTMEMKMMAAYETPESIAYLTGASTKHSYGRMLLEYWINGLISGPATHTTYMMGNALLSLEKGLLETPVAAALGALRPGRGNIVHFGEAAARLRGAVSGFAPAMEAAGRAASTGLTGRLPGQDTMRALPFQGDQALPLAGPMLNEKATMSDAKGAWFGASRGILDGMMSIGKILDATPAGERTAAPLYSPMGAIPDVRLRGGVLPVGQLARLPSRGIAVIHTFLRGMNYSMEKSALSYRMAANEGKTGAALAARVAQLRLDTPDEIMTASTTGATDLTLMGPAGAFVRKISELTNWAPNIPGLGETPVLKFIDPFVHIAANIIDQSIVQRTPAGLLSPEIRADLMGKNGAAAQDMAQARMIVGTAMSLGFGALAANGYVSGSGPTDRNKAAIWRMAGNQAHSVKIGDVWYQTNRLGPLGMIMGVAADMYDVAHLASQGDMLAAGAMLQHAITQNVLDESFMRGPAELIQAVEDPGRYGERYIQNFASSFVPYSVGLAQIDRASDPFSRQARTVMDSIKQKIPGLSETLFPRRDVWGEPLPNHDALAAAGLTAIYKQRVSRDMVNLSLAQLGIGIGPVDRTIRGVKLTDQQYDDFARLAGRMTKQRLDVIVNSPDWRQWPPGVRANVVKEVVTQSRESACGMIFMKFPSVYAEATRMKAPKYGEAQ